MTDIPVYAESPSALADPRIVEQSGDAVVSWHPERGWLCEVHTVQPCDHTAGLTPAKSTLWEQ
jgi:hypothetical protein